MNFHFLVQRYCFLRNNAKSFLVLLRVAFVYVRILLYFCSAFWQVSTHKKSTNGSCSCSEVLGKPVNTNKKRPC